MASVPGSGTGAAPGAVAQMSAAIENVPGCRFALAGYGERERTTVSLLELADVIGHHLVVDAVVTDVVHPGIVAQQMESAIVFGLSAALYGRVDIVASVVQQNNFPNHPILTMAQTPRIETHLVASTNVPGGVGEPGTPPVAPALANALFALTGRRLRELPLL